MRRHKCKNPEPAILPDGPHNHLTQPCGVLVADESSEPSLFDAVQESGPRKATPERLARRYRPVCVIDAVCPAMVTSVDRCAPAFAGMNSST